MKRPCVICKQENVVVDGRRTNVMIERGGAAVTIRNVPGRVCESCGEKYFDARTSERLLEIADSVFRSGVDFAVRDYETKVAA